MPPSASKDYMILFAAMVGHQVSEKEAAKSKAGIRRWSSGTPCRTLEIRHRGARVESSYWMV